MKKESMVGYTTAKSLMKYDWFEYKGKKDYQILGLPVITKQSLGEFGNDTKKLGERKVRITIKELSGKEQEEQLINLILDWMRERDYGGKDGHSPAIILAKRIEELFE